MLKPSRSENRLYLAAFLALIMLTFGFILYYEGGIDESARHSRERDSMMAAEVENNRILQARYDALASEADAVTVIAAEEKYQTGRAEQ